MILQSLKALAEREGLVVDPAFEIAGVSWAIDLSRQGRFLSLRDLRQQGSGKAKKTVARQMLVPRRSKRTVNNYAEFAVDKAEYVLGIDEADPGRGTKRAALFLSKMRRMAADVEHEAIAAVLGFYGDQEGVAAAIQEARQEKVADNDLICFLCDDVYLHDVEAVRAYWKRHRRAPSGGRLLGQCLLCGEAKPVVPLHPNVKGLRGASTSGVPMVSFNHEAFLSYGWDKHHTAPMCEDCATAYATALNRCLSGSFPDPKDEGSILPRQATGLTDSLTAVYWSDDRSAGVEEAICQIDDPERMERLFDSPYRGMLGPQTPRFHCLLIQGAQGRASIRNYVNETLPAMREHLRRWSQDMRIRGIEKPVTLYDIRRSLAVQGKFERLPANLMAELYLAALFGRPIPRLVLQLTVIRNRVERDVPAARAALLQTWINRHPSSLERRPLVALDRDFPSIGYQLGRVLAVCESIEYRKSQGRVNRGITDRYFPALSTRPRLVFGPLMKLVEVHLAQIRRAGGASLKSELAEVVGGIHPGDLPAQLPLEEQANFALGYYHQRALRFMKKGASAESGIATASEGQEE